MKTRRPNTLALSLAALSLTALAGAQTAPEPAPEPAPAWTQRRWLVHLNGAMAAYTYAGATDTLPSSSVTPADRVTLYQQLGVGYYVRPDLRIQTTLQLGETVSGLPQSASAFTLGAVIAWAVYTRGPFFAGAGPIFAARSYGEWAFDMGIFTAVGASVPIGGGFSLGLAVQAPFWFARRFAVGVAPSLFIAKRF